MAWRSPCARMRSDTGIERAFDLLLATRPTAINLRWALARMREAVAQRPARRPRRARLGRSRRDLRRGRRNLPQQSANMGCRSCAKPRQEAWQDAQRAHPLQCRLARLTVDWGTALAPIYMAYDAGIPLHVWVDETRPRNQGASLTALRARRPRRERTPLSPTMPAAISCSTGQVDLCIVGTDRVTRQRRRRQQDRHLSEGAGGARQWRALLCRAAVIHHRLDAGRGGATFRSRNAPPTKLLKMTGRLPDGGLATVRDRGAAAAPRPIPAST